MQDKFTDNITTIVLAAGNGTRMKSSQPKVMHRIAGQSMLEYVIEQAITTHSRDIRVVTSNSLSNDTGYKLLKEKYGFLEITQHQQNGTGDAVLQACNFADIKDFVIILYGDTPFIQESTIQKMLSKINDGINLVSLGFHCMYPNEYGKFIIGHNDSLLSISEGLKSNDSLCNAGIMIVTKQLLTSFFQGFKNSESNDKEFYLTRIVEYANNNGFKSSFIVTEKDEVIGVNDRAALAEAENIFQNTKKIQLMKSGVTLIMPETIYISKKAHIEHDVTIYPHVYIGENVVIKQNSNIYSFSHIEGVNIDKNCNIGPYARIRPKSNLGEGVKIGNFVEVKNAQINSKTTASHLSYLGDVDIGKNCNIGAGTIFCNYDGKKKHRSTLGDQVFVGSNSAIISPIKINDKAMVAAGSVITKNVDKDDLAIARSKQINIKKKQPK